MASPKDHYACARICVEVDLEAGLPEAIKLTVGNWSHFQRLDYEQLPFKCRGCQEYGHFIRNCPKKPEVHHDKGDGWKKVNRNKPKKHSDPKTNEGSIEAKIIQLEGSPEASKTKENTVEREEPVIVEEKSSNEHSKEVEADLSAHQIHDQEDSMTEMQEGRNPGRSEEESESEEDEEEEGEIEMITPRQPKSKGRKTRREVREKATYKDKLQGSQPTLEKLLKNPRNTRQQGHAHKGMPSNTKSK